MLLSHNNSFASEAVRVVGEVYFALSKLYWIDNQLADVSTRFYTSASWRRQVGPSAS